MSAIVRSLILASSLIFAGGASAHGKDGVHVMGVVREVTDTTLKVERDDKTTVEVTLHAKTAFARGDATVTAQDIVVGEKVVVHAKKDASGALKAELVKLAKRQASSPTKDPEHDHSKH